jgi:hypothetical protein
MATDTTALTPVEIDTILAANYNEQAKTQAHITADIRHLDRIKNSKWGTPAEIDRTAATLEKNREILRGLIAASAPYQLEYSRRPWNRYFLVDNTNGHVHRGMDCTTCFRTTQYSWLVDLADCDEDAMIEEWGELACTVCFPSAPTNPNYNRPSRRDREAQAAREAEKAAKDAAKAEKAIFDVDGSPLKDSNGYPLKTKVAARNELSRAIQWFVSYGSQEYADQVRHLVPALKAAGVDWQKVASNAVKRAVKDSVVPPNNPYRLTPEQIATHEAEIKVNSAKAQDLLKEVAV